MKMPDSTISAERDYQASLERGEARDRQYRKEATENVIERLFGVAPEYMTGKPDVFVTVDHMLNEPEKYGFDGNAIRFTEDIANAISASARGLTWHHDLDREEDHIQDAAHYLVFHLARMAVDAILASPYGQECIEDEIDRLAENDA